MWGWGQASLGDPRAWALALAEIAALAGLFVVGLPRITGADADLVFAASAVFFCAWGAIAIDAYKRASRLRASLGIMAEDGGAIELLWLTGPLILASSLFWTTAGTLGSPQAVLARYVTDWRRGSADDAGLLFDSAPVPTAVRLAWSHQSTRLVDSLQTLAASAGPAAGIDPNAPFDSLRFELTDPESSGATTREVSLRVVRHQTYRDSFFGLVPTSADHLVTLADVGAARLRMVDGQWRLIEVDVLGERLGSP